MWEQACPRWERLGKSGIPSCLHREQARSHVKIGTTVKYFIEVKDELVPNEVYFMIKADQDWNY
ncbi:MAG: hypothetical protein J6L74_03000, partial [Pseudomonas sp.]|nr:hypothetical protein [Pseudomonas sp.]